MLADIFVKSSTCSGSVELLLILNVSEKKTGNCVIYYKFIQMIRNYGSDVFNGNMY